MLNEITSHLTRFLGVAADDFDLVRLKLLTTIALKPDVFHQECPHIVTEPVGFQVALQPESVDPR